MVLYVGSPCSTFGDQPAHLHLFFPSQHNHVL